MAKLTTTQKINEVKSKALGRDGGAGIQSAVGLARKGKRQMRNKRTSLEDQLKLLYARYGYEWDQSLNVFGIRNEDDIKKDVFNDVIGAWVDGKLKVYKGTTDPGIYWADNNNRRKHGYDEMGAAHLCLGQHKLAYQIGTHRGYKALAQWGNKVTIWRDVNSNWIKDSADPLQTGFFGINIHAGSGPKIDLDSAGCQVVLGWNMFNSFLHHVESSQKLQKSPASRFHYTLFEKAQFPDLYETLMVAVEK